MVIVYIPLSADIFHHGHLNLIKEGRKHGDVVVGLMTDEILAKYKRLSFLPYEKRKEIVENIKGVIKVIPQDSLDLGVNIRELKPDYMMHGDDWQKGYHTKTRENSLVALDEYGGKLIDVPYTKDISSTQLQNYIKNRGITSEQRIPLLKKTINIKPLSIFIESDNSELSLILENISIKGREGLPNLVDGILIDNCEEVFLEKINTIIQILDKTSKPLIIKLSEDDLYQDILFKSKTLQRLGISGIIVTYNEKFMDKISLIKNSQITEDFMVIVQIYLNKSEQLETLKKCKKSIDSGADAIIIDIKNNSYEDICNFSREYNKIKDNVPLICISNPENKILKNQLKNVDIKLVIYENVQKREITDSKNIVEKILLND